MGDSDSPWASAARLAALSGDIVARLTAVEVELGRAQEREALATQCELLAVESGALLGGIAALTLDAYDHPSTPVLMQRFLFGTAVAAALRSVPFRQPEPQASGESARGVAGDACSAGNECGRLGCPECQA